MFVRVCADIAKSLADMDQINSVDRLFWRRPVASEWQGGKDLSIVKIYPHHQFGKYNLHNARKMHYIVDSAAMYLTA